MSQKELLKELLKKIPDAPVLMSAADVPSLMPPVDAPWAPQLDALRGVAKRWGWKLDESEDSLEVLGVEKGDAAGMTSLRKRAIWVKSPQPDSWKVYVLAHELGHARQPISVWFQGKFERELFAESTAWLVLKSIVPEWENTVSPAYLLNGLLSGGLKESDIVVDWRPNEVIMAADAILTSINATIPLQNAA